jgi:sensitive to high expression protein 9, mitochondrial
VEKVGFEHADLRDVVEQTTAALRTSVEAFSAKSDSVAPLPSARSLRMFAVGPTRGCLACIYASKRAVPSSTTLLHLAASPFRRRCLSSSTPSEPAATPPPSSSSTFSTKAPPRGITTERLAQARTQAQLQLNALLATLNSTARKHGRSWAAALAALELERKLREVGGKINQATGYEEIERLRLGVADRGACESCRVRTAGS